MTTADQPPRRIGRAAAWAVAGAVWAAPVPTPSRAQPAPQPAAVAAAPLNLDQLVRQNLDDDVRTLLNGPAQAQRDEAARRLVARQSLDGRQGLLAALTPPPPPPNLTPQQLAAASASQLAAKVAAARAISEDPSPSPQFVRPLGELLGAGPGADATKAAVAALANFRDEPVATDASRAVTQMIATAGHPFWEAGVRASGASVDRRVALALVQLTTDNRAPGGARDAAADALLEMTGLARNGRDPNEWRKWAAGVANRNLNAEQFRADLFAGGGGAAGRRPRRAAQVVGMDAVVDQFAKLATPAARANALTLLLDAPDPTFRAAGARLLYRTVVLEGLPMPAAPLSRVRDLVRDSAPEVRAEAARTLGELNDKATLAGLLAQLRVDTDPGVRAVLAESVARFGDPRTIDELLKLLDQDPSLAVVAAAGRALARLAAVVRRDPQLRAQVVAAATGILARENAQPARDGEGLRRAACVEVLASLGERAQLPAFIQLLNVNQPRALRQAVLTALGDLGDAQAAQAVMNWIGREPDADVRKFALAAIEKVGSFGFAQPLYQFTTPAAEPDANVRKRAWEAFVNLMPKGDEKSLEDWAELFRKEQNNERLLAVLRALAVKREGLGAAGAEALVLTREAIGDALVKLGRPAEAVGPYRQALDHWRGVNNAELTIAGLTRVLLDAQLAAKQYKEAAAFAAESIARDNKLQDRVLAPIANEAERLLAVGQPAARGDAQRLSAEALNALSGAAMTQPYRGRLEAVRQATQQPGNGVP